MKFNSILKIAIAILLLFGLALILPKPTIITDEPIVQNVYQSTTHFLNTKLEFDITLKESIWLALYSLIVGILIWAYYHLILLIRTITEKDWKKIRNPEIEGLNTKLLSLSRFRLINILFGNIYKVIGFVIFTIILYNIPILNRLIYLYMLEFLNLRFIADAVIMAILMIILPPFIESFLFQKRKTKMEKGIMKIEKIKAMVSSAEKETANI